MLNKKTNTHTLTPRQKNQKNIKKNFKANEENLTCVPEIFAKIKQDENTQSERFPCPVCGKSYLRRRHLQRHMRGEQSVKIRMIKISKVFNFERL